MNIIKNCTEVWSQLFDHKSFIQSELNSFVKEFEEKRLDREVVNLLDILNVECEINESCDKIHSVEDSTLKSLNEKVTECFKHTDNILNNIQTKKENSILEIRRKQREEEWKKFNEDMKPKYIDLDIQFKRQLEEIKKIYESKENQLND